MRGGWEVEWHHVVRDGVAIAKGAYRHRMTAVRKPLTSNPLNTRIDAWGL